MFSKISKFLGTENISSFNFNLNFVAKSLPKNPCSTPCGEDSCFFMDCEDFENYVFGVFDGVGGFSEYGVDSSVYSDALMNRCKEAVESWSIRSLNDLTPKNVIEKSFQKVKKDTKIKAGGSTSCICIFDRNDGVLDCYNLGDSGILVFRYFEENEWKVIEKTGPQQHYFNCPYQLVKVPKGKENVIMPGDSIHDGNSYVFENLQENDIILVCSDGLSDNVFDSEIEDFLTERTNVHGFKENGEIDIDIDDVSTDLLNLAWENAVSKVKETPFSQEVGNMEGERVLGGKLDDITIIMAMLEKNNL